MNPTIFQYALTAWVLIITIYVARLQLANNYIIGMASKYGAIMGKKSGEVRSKAKQTRMDAENKVLLLEAVVSEVPFAAKIVGYLREQGTTDQQLFSMMTDPDALRGIKALSDTFGGIIGGATKLLEGRQEPKKKVKGEYDYLTNPQ
jgi:hypothetical protein